MRSSSLSQLADSTLKNSLKDLVVTDRGTTARLLAHMAEFHARKLYREDGYSSMYAYCLGELRMSEDVASKRIRAAKAARRRRHPSRSRSPLPPLPSHKHWCQPRPLR